MAAQASHPRPVHQPGIAYVNVTARQPYRQRPRGTKGKVFFQRTVLCQEPGAGWEGLHYRCCIPGTSAARASFSLCPPAAAVPLIKGLATLAMQGSELQAFCSHPTPTLGLIGAPGQCLCRKSQCLDRAEIVDHWCHKLIKDSGRQVQGEGHRFFPTQDLSGDAWLATG